MQATNILPAFTIVDRDPDRARLVRASLGVPTSWARDLESAENALSTQPESVLLFDLDTVIHLGSSYVLDFVESLPRRPEVWLSRPAHGRDPELDGWVIADLDAELVLFVGNIGFLFSSELSGKESDVVDAQTHGGRFEWANQAVQRLEPHQT